jgi:RNA polymerase sigma factor (sigma-70 family)
MVFTLAYNIMLNREDAEEVAQDVFVKAFTSLSAFKQQSKFSTWLYRITVNTALNKKKVQKLVTVDMEENLSADEQINDTVLLQEEHKDMKQFIQQAMRALPDNERICITLFYLNELSVIEIGELTGITTSSIKVLLHRGRKHLYTELNNLLKTELNNLK